MALLESQVLDTAQHVLVCRNKDCEKNCQFYCNPCHKPICEQCRDEHQKSPNTKNHEVVPYPERNRQLPVEKCRDHPTKDLDILCDQCNVPLCSKCSTIPAHKGHSFTDLEIIYTEKSAACHQENNKIEAYFIPTARDLRNEIKIEATNIKTIMDDIRSSMRDEGKSLKRLVDEVTSDNTEQVNKMEESLREMLQSQDKTYQDYISYLEDFVTKFHGYLSFTPLKNNPIIFPLTELFKIQPIPETIKPVPPNFTAGHYSKEDVAKLVGRIAIPDTKPENRKIKPMETASTQLKPTSKQTKHEREKSDVKQTLSLSSSVTKVREYTVPGVDSVYHISLGKSGRLWVSDRSGNLVQTDLQGNQLQKIQTRGELEGYHTVIQNGDLIYTDKENKVGEGKVTRYNNTGKEIQNIQRNSTYQELYSNPHYITENINGDIIVSDLQKEAVVVVNKSGHHRFSFTGQGSTFYPKGVCTDLLGHILVCDIYSDTVHLLDQDGQFMCLLLTEVVKDPRSVCVDDENNLIVGQSNTNTVTVYKYLQ
eukprot:XP_019928157.1 PREDICTED: E3 ubiquitin-protein ligase TRIM71-like [Crassostrea gigas]